MVNWKTKHKSQELLRYWKLREFNQLHFKMKP